MQPCLHTLRNVIVTLAMLAPIDACAPLHGYPDDPEDTSATLAALVPYFDPAVDRSYNAMPPGASRQSYRDLIVMSRMRAYDLEFDSFERRLNGDSNAVALGGDVTLLVLGALTATLGSATTKAALGAASTAVAGAQTAVNKDLYFQKTLPAMLDQMEANRAKAKLVVFQGLALPDAQYPLVRAEIDLQILKQSGSIPAAISVITKTTSLDNQAAQAELTASYSFNDLSRKIRGFWKPDGNTVDADHAQKLQRCMDQNKIAGSIPFLINAGAQADKEKLISCLGI